MQEERPYHYTAGGDGDEEGEEQEGNTRRGDSEVKNSSEEERWIPAAGLLNYATRQRQQKHRKHLFVTSCVIQIEVDEVTQVYIKTFKMRGKYSS